MKHIIKREPSNRVPRIAFIGCGAIVEQFHLPAVKHLGLKPEIFVDPNVTRAKSMAKPFRGDAAADYSEVMERFDAAVVSVPHNLHASICVELLRNGKHVLVEKPMATTPAECSEMNGTAEENNAVLAVGLFRRYFNSTRWVKSFLQSGCLGLIKRFEFKDGAVYSWPVTTDSFWNREKSKGGVLMDTGAHVLDQLMWWLGEVEHVDYMDDSYGGVEADCILHLRLRGGAEGVVELSRTRKLGSRATIVGDKGTLMVELSGNHLMSQPAEMIESSFDGIRGSNIPNQSFAELFKLQLSDWLAAITARQETQVDGREGAKAIALIDRCYRNRKPWNLPWVETWMR